MLAMAGGLAVFAAAFLIGRNFRWENRWTVFSTDTLYQPVLGAVLLAALTFSAAGFFLGLNSAGQKRNTQSSLAWLAFFVNASVITAAICCGLFFALTRYPMAPPAH